MGIGGGHPSQISRRLDPLMSDGCGLPARGAWLGQLSRASLVGIEMWWVDEGVPGLALRGTVCSGNRVERCELLLGLGNGIGGLVGNSRVYRLVRGFSWLFRRFVVSLSCGWSRGAVCVYVQHVSGVLVVFVGRLRSCGPNCLRTTTFQSWPKPTRLVASPLFLC